MTCTRCGKAEEIYHVPYSGQQLCRTCFLRFMEQRVQKTISEHSMLQRNDRIALAVSGGKDSVSLLHILHNIERNYPSASLVAVCVDEGIEGYRHEALKIVRTHCELLNVELAVFSFSDLFNTTLDALAQTARGHDSALTPCSYCGVLRRKALNYAAKRVAATKLATAHNLDDEVQTALMNVIHGDIHRIARTGPVTPASNSGFVKRIKPFRTTPESEIALYAYLKHIEFQSSPCPHGGLALRNKIRDFVNRLEVSSPGTKYTILRSFDKLRSLMEPPPYAEVKPCTLCGEPCVEGICEGCGMLMKLVGPSEPSLNLTVETLCHKLNSPSNAQI